MGPLFSVVLVVALTWLVWRVSPRRRMIRNRVKGEITAESTSGVPANLSADLASLEQRSRNMGGEVGGGGIGGMGI